MIDASLTLAEAVEKARGGSEITCRCPGHEDSSPSLSVALGAGKVILKCHAGCDTRDVLAAAGMTWADLFDPDDNLAPENSWTPAGEASHIYPYIDEQGSVLYEVLRVPKAGGGKTFFQRTWSEVQSKYIWSVRDVRRVLYRLPDVLNCVANGETVYVTEGERDADTVRRMGLCSTTNAMGAGKWEDDYTDSLAGATIVMLSDADAAGRAHTRMVRERLIEAGCRVEIREPRGDFKDITEMHQKGGGGIDEMMVVVPFQDAERIKFGIDVLDVILRPASITEFVIPGTLARRERLLVTGLEGHGKSTLLRQIAVQVAAGIHPFALTEAEPKRVLVIDAENEPGQTRQSWTDLVGLAAYHGHPIERDQLIVLEEWDTEIDLADKAWHEWLHERIHGYQPDLVILGPLTNLVGRDLKDDEPVRRLKSAINTGRTICDSAFIMEHHAPHRNPSDKKRSLRPYGSSMFLKWPDYGYGMSPDADREGHYQWERTRWPRVRTRNWPDTLRWGLPNTSEWMWMEAEPA